jgi:hypothetical protein
MALTQEQIDALPEDIRETVVADQEAAAAAETKNQALEAELLAAKEKPAPDPNKEGPTVQEQLDTLKLEGAKDRITKLYPEVSLDLLVSTSPVEILEEAKRMNGVITGVTEEKNKELEALKAERILHGLSDTPASASTKGADIPDGGLTETISKINTEAKSEADSLKGMCGVASSAIFTGAGLNVQKEA